MSFRYPEYVPNGIAYADGAYIPLKDLSFSIADLGYTQGAATYDVGHVIDNNFFRLDWHLERFYRSAAGLYLHIPYNQAELTDILRQCVIRARLTNALIWMGITQGIPETGNPRDYHLCKPRFYAYAKPYYGISSEKDSQAKGVSLSISNVQRIPPKSVNPHYKNHHWLDLRHAQMEAKRKGYDTTILVDIQGNIAEGPGFNVCAVRNGAILTPDKTALQGITIRAVHTIAKELRIPFSFASISPNELRCADEVFITSTSGGITPVVSIDKEPLPNGHGPMTAQLQQVYWHKHYDAEWTTPVE